MASTEGAQLEENSCNQALKPLSWLIGKWKSVTAEGSYPTITPFYYCEEILFESLGQPVLNYVSRTYHPVKKVPMHLESGFLRIKPGTNQVAFMVAHNFGLTTLEEGIVSDHELKCKSTEISRMSFAKDPEVLTIERVWKLNDEGNLDVTVLMETANTPLTRHLKVTLQKL